MAINSKRKGSKNERVVADLFQLWTGFEFARTPASGGLRWKGRDDTVGDVVCTDQTHTRKFPFTVETKFHKDINFEHLISANKNIAILKFWSQAKDEASRSSKIPILMVRYDQMEKGMYYLFIPRKFFEDIIYELEFEYGYLSYFNPSTKDHFVILSSKDFFHTEYEEVRKIAKQYLRDGR